VRLLLASTDDALVSSTLDVLILKAGEI